MKRRPSTLKQQNNVDSPPPYSACSVQVTNNSNPCNPPSYNESIYPQEPPPTYQSLYGRVIEARNQSSNSIDFFNKLLNILKTSLGYILALCISFGLSISIISMGLIYREKCTLDRRIPIFLIIGGLFWTVKNLVYTAECLYRIVKKDEDLQNNSGCSDHFSRIHTFLNLFLFPWFISMKICVFILFSKFSTDKNSENYCDPVFFHFVFGTLLSIAILCLLIMTIFCACQGLRPKQNITPEN